MKDFYKGSKVLNDKVLDNYLKGFYMDKGVKVQLSSKVNKYNLEIIANVNELNGLFYQIIMAERFILRLMEKVDENLYVERNNIYRLMSSQSGTINFNRVFRGALKKYAIDRKEVLKSIRQDITVQYNRVERNKNLLLDFVKELGLYSIIELIEENTGKDIFNHIAYFIDELQEDIAYGAYKSLDNDKDKEEINNYYNNLLNKYMEFVEDLAFKNNIELKANVSESLKRYRSNIENKIIQKKEEDKAKRKQERTDNLKEVLDRDNCILQRDMMANYDEKLVKIDRVAATKLYEKISILGGKAFYIAMTKKEKVYYLTFSKVNSKLWSTNIEEARLFNNEQQEHVKYFIEGFNKAKTDKDSENYELLKNSYINAYILNTGNNKTLSVKIDNLALNVKTEINKNIDYWSTIRHLYSYNYDGSPIKGVIYIMYDKKNDKYYYLSFDIISGLINNIEKHEILGNIKVINESLSKRLNILGQLKNFYEECEVYDRIINIYPKYLFKFYEDADFKIELLRRLVNKENLEQKPFETDFKIHFNLSNGGYSKNRISILRSNIRNTIESENKKNLIINKGIVSLFCIVGTYYASLEYYKKIKGTDSFNLAFSNMKFFTSFEKASETAEMIFRTDKKLMMVKVMKFDVALRNL